MRLRLYAAEAHDVSAGRERRDDARGNTDRTGNPCGRLFLGADLLGRHIS